MFVGIGSLFSIFILFNRIMDITYCMAVTLISSNVCLMFILGILNITLILFIKGGMCSCPHQTIINTSSLQDIIA